jgi:hypothetical protein
VPPATGSPRYSVCHRLDLVGIADPDRDRHLLGEADEPGVAVVLGRAGLAGGELVEPGLDGRAAGHHRREDLVGGLRDALGEHALGLLAVLVDDVAALVRAALEPADLADADGPAVGAERAR